MPVFASVIYDIDLSLQLSGSLHLKDIISCLNERLNLRKIYLNRNGSASCVESTNEHFELFFPFEFDQALFSNSCDDTQEITQTSYYLYTKNMIKAFADEKLLPYLNENGIDTVIVFVQWPETIFLWEYLSHQNLNIYPILMDDFKPLLISFPHTPKAEQIITQTYFDSLSNSTGVIAGSVVSSNEIQNNYQVPSIDALSVFRSDPYNYRKLLIQTSTF